MLIPLWKRHRLSRLVLSYYQRLSDELAAEGIHLHIRCVVSPGDAVSYALCEDLGIDFAEHPNGFLSDKINAGLAYFRGLDFDAYIKMDSDSLACPRFFRTAARYAEAGARYVIPDSLYFLNVFTRECLYVRCRKIGIGRVLARSELQRTSWRPYQAGVHRGTDGALCRGLGSNAHRSLVDIRSKGITLLDVKTDVNMWSFSSVRRNLGGGPVDPAEVLQAFPGEAEALLNFASVYADG